MFNDTDFIKAYIEEISKEDWTDESLSAVVRTLPQDLSAGTYIEIVKNLEKALEAEEKDFSDEVQRLKNTRALMSLSISMDLAHSSTVVATDVADSSQTTQDVETDSVAEVVVADVATTEEGEAPAEEEKAEKSENETA